MSEQASDHFKVSIRGDRVYFQIGVQGFTLEYDPDDDEEKSKTEQLHWMAGQLQKALHKLEICRLDRRENPPLFIKLVPAILAVGVVAASFVLYAASIFADISEDARGIAQQVIGSLNTIMSMILGYHFGSTKSSDSKSSALEAMAKKG